MSEFLKIKLQKCEDTLRNLAEFLNVQELESNVGKNLEQPTQRKRVKT